MLGPTDDGEQTTQGEATATASRATRLGRGLVRALNPDEQLQIGDWAAGLLTLRDSELGVRRKAKDALALTYRSRR
jgi:hypothetical protein